MLRAARLLASVVIAILCGASMARAAERIAFESAARDITAVQIFQGEAVYSDRIYGDLQLPAQGSAPFPAMVVMHSSRGVESNLKDWAKLFNDMGIATFVVYSFAARGLSEASATRLTFPADVVDALRALQALQHESRIDAKNIGIIGFSLGAIGAMGSSFERYRAAILGADGGKFAFHIAFYGGCSQFAKTTGSPILTFMGTKDDFSNVEVCRKHAEILNQQGTKAELVVYEGAPHDFDMDYPLVFMPMIQNSRNCTLMQNMDTFETTFLDGSTVPPEERVHYAQSCRGSGASRGGDRKFAVLARERVRQFVAEQLGLKR